MPGIIWVAIPTGCSWVASEIQYSVLKIQALPYLRLGWEGWAFFYLPVMDRPTILPAPIFAEPHWGLLVALCDVAADVLDAFGRADLESLQN